MLAYRTPGVYFEWPDTRVPALRPLRTDVAGFIGIAAAGPLHTPVRIESMTQFASIFGEHIEHGYLAYAVEGFFANGGATCWVVRVADPDIARPAFFVLLDETKQPALRLTAITNITSSDGQHHVYANPGAAGNRITFSLVHTARDRFTLTLQLGNVREIWRDLSMNPCDTRYVCKLINGERDDDSCPGRAKKRAGSPAADEHARVRGGGSRLVRAADLLPLERSQKNTPDPDAPNLRGGSGHLNCGRDGIASLTSKHFSGEGSPVVQAWGLAALETVDEISIVAMPDIMPKALISPRKPKEPPLDCSKLDPNLTPSDFCEPAAKPEPPDSDGPGPEPLPARCGEPDPETGVPARTEEPAEFPRGFDEDEISQLQSALVSHCLKLKDRFAVLDTPPTRLTTETVVDWRLQRLSGDGLKYAALYFPWLLVPDPLGIEGLLRAVPPSGHVAGVYARGDRRVGVHKPPANEELEAAKDVRVALDDIAHGDLNERGVNVLRDYPRRGIRVAGARTLSEDPAWRYVNVRRLVTMIEEALDEQTQWTVFEPNNQNLWRELDRVARNFLQGLWLRGMLDGATAEEAFSVRCDETTNPSSETDQGRMICEIGLLPPWPAEFVIVRIGKTEGRAEFFETAGAINA